MWHPLLDSIRNAHTFMPATQSQKKKINFKVFFMDIATYILNFQIMLLFVHLQFIKL